MNNLRCESRREQSGFVMKLAGQFTFAEMEAFNEHVRQVATQQPARLVLDMSELDIITSAGIGALLRLQAQMKGHRCEIRIAALRPDIAKVLELAKLDQIFAISHSVADALN